MSDDIEEHIKSEDADYDTSEYLVNDGDHDTASNGHYDIDLKSERNTSGRRAVEVSSLIKPSEIKFSSRSRLFVGNIGNSCTVEDVRSLFEQFGETSEVYVNRDKGYGILRMDYKINAEVAINKLNQSSFKSRQISVRFATMASAIEVEGVGPFICDQSLAEAFGQFGQIEKATVIVDEKGKSKGYGIVEYASKKSAQAAIQRVNEGLFCLERLPKPVSVKVHEATDNETGISERDLERLPGYAQERDRRARFITPDSFEFQWAQRWRALILNEKQQREVLEAQLRAGREKLELEMTSAIHDSEAEAMRQELLRKTEELRRHEEVRRQEEQRRQESIRQREMELRRQEDMRLQDAWRRDEARRQDEFISRQKQELEARGVPPTMPTRDPFRPKMLSQGSRPPLARMPPPPTSMPPPTINHMVPVSSQFRTNQSAPLSASMPPPSVAPMATNSLPPRGAPIPGGLPPRMAPVGPSVLPVPVPVPVPIPTPATGLRPPVLPPPLRPPFQGPQRPPMDPRGMPGMFPGMRRDMPIMPGAGPIFDAKRMRRF